MKTRFYDIYYEATAASNTQNALRENTAVLKNCIQRLSANLQTISDNWGNEQADFLNFKNAIDRCIFKYKDVCELNEEVCQVISEFSAFIEQLSSEKIN